MIKYRISHVRITTNIIGVIMKVINAENAIGTVLCHDLTQIIPGQYKGAKFKKGHVIKKRTFLYFFLWGKDISMSMRQVLICSMKMRQHFIFVICV